MAMTDTANVIWHDLECGLYRADLPLWRELAAEYRERPILDVGAGTGRVALDLALTGREVIALDRDPGLLAALRDRDPDRSVETVCADARDFKLEPAGGVDLVLVPMQTVQLLGGPAGRGGFLQAARRHLRPGGLLACALVTEVEPFDCRDGGQGPSAERMRIGDRLFSSQALRVELDVERITIERERRISWAPSGEVLERNVIELDRLSAPGLEREAAAVGLRAEPARTIAATDEHTGSTVVMLRG